jgi:hypothetical protein
MLRCMCVCVQHNRLCIHSCVCSITDCVFEVARKTTAEEVNAFLKEAADGGELNPKPSSHVGILLFLLLLYCDIFVLVSIVL